jgi:hypothetical protein
MSTPSDFAQQLNANVNASLEPGNHAGKTKVSSDFTKYTRDRLREVSFANKVMVPEPIKASDCQVSLTQDTLTRIEELEPNSRAMSIDFRSGPTTRLVQSNRYQIGFFTISSEKFEKYEQELLAYRMPVTKVIEENSIKDLQDILDRRFLLYSESAVQAVQLLANGGAATAMTVTNVLAGSVIYGSTIGTAGFYGSVVKGDGALAAGATDFTKYPVMKTDLIKVKQILHRKHLRAYQMLITEPDFDDLSAFTIQDVGFKMVEETMIEGYKAPTAVGLRIIRTIKADILREGTIYVYTTQDFLGHSYVLNAPKFYIDKIANLITWQVWTDVGMGIGNIASVVKLELFGGSVTPSATTSGYAAQLPVAESQLNLTQNNQADQNYWYPSYTTY